MGAIMAQSNDGSGRHSSGLSTAISRLLKRGRNANVIIVIPVSAHLRWPGFQIRTSLISMHWRSNLPSLLPYWPASHDGRSDGKEGALPAPYHFYVHQHRVSFRQHKMEPSLSGALDSPCVHCDILAD